MTALLALGLVAAFSASVLFLAGVGAALLRALRCSAASAADRSLFSIAAGTILFELAVSAGQLAPGVRTGVRLACAAFGLAGLLGLRNAIADLRECLKNGLILRGAERWLAAALFLVLALQGLASLAPLTGSDALHYHFAAQQIYLNEGFHAPWSLLHGFFCGLGHQLILASLALGSGRLAQLWLFLGGAVATLATLRVARLWSDGIWPWLAALAFALTPVSVWQITAAGAPDIWMCALVPLCFLATVLATVQPGKNSLPPNSGAIVLAGIFAGAAAGTKYTGLLLAAALLAGFLFAARSLSRSMLFFLTAALVGMWPYLRNWVWTGDPAFPFLVAHSHSLQAAGFNAAAVQSILADTGASHSFRVWELLKFPFFAAVDYQHLGLWQLLGPLVLVFAPIAVPQLRKSLHGRVAILIWFAGSLLVGFNSAMARFLLPLLPIALAASIAGAALAMRHRWRVLRVLSLLTLGGFIFAGFVAMAFYSRPSWSVALGRVAPEEYLAANAPDYQMTQFVNREVPRLGGSGRVLLSFHHLYYLQVPYYYGDPDDSWEMNPDTLNAADSQRIWRRLFARHQIHWVLKAPGYPEELAASLARLEREGILFPCATGEVEDFSGNRIEGVRIRVPLTLMCVHE